MTETIVFYGDSETALNGWTTLIQQGASAAGADITIINTAVPGESSSWGLANLQANALAYHPNIVVFEFSMNDAVWWPLSQAASNTTAMIQQIQATGARAFISTNNEPTAAAIASTLAIVPSPNLANVDAFYAQYRTIAAATGAGLIDNEPAWDNAQAANPAIVPDGFHPTLTADVLVQIPNVMHALGLSFPVYQPGVAMAVPTAMADNMLVWYAATGEMPPGNVRTLNSLGAMSLGTLSNELLQMTTVGDQLQELTWIMQNALGRAPTSADVAWYTAPGQTAQAMLLGIATSAEAHAHAASWLAVF
jgi:hypothetical protein